MTDAKCDRNGCGGRLMEEKDEYNKRIRRCILCSRSPDENVNFEDVMYLVRGPNWNKKHASGDIK